MMEPTTDGSAWRPSENLTVWDARYLVLIDSLYKVVQSTKGTRPEDPRDLAISDLALKLYLHAVSAWWLHRGMPLPPTIAHKEHGPGALLGPDFCTVMVIARAATECFLAYHHVFVEPKDDEHFVVHYNAWRLAGYTETNAISSIQEHITTDANRAMIEQENKRLRDELKSNAVFRGLKGEDQRRILSGRKFPLRPYSELSSLVYGKRLARYYYGFLAGTSHSDGRSAELTRGADTLEIRQSLADAALFLTGASVAHMVSAYAKRFLVAKGVLESDPAIMGLIDAFTDVPASIDEVVSAHQPSRNR